MLKRKVLRLAMLAQDDHARRMVSWGVEGLMSGVQGMEIRGGKPKILKREGGQNDEGKFKA